MANYHFSLIVNDIDENDAQGILTTYSNILSLMGVSGDVALFEVDPDGGLTEIDFEEITTKQED